MTKNDELKYVGLIGGGIWEVPAVDRQPVVRLESWQVFRLGNGDTHLVGWHEAGQEGRVSTRVVALDAGRREAMTESGRRYELVGPNGSNGDALYVWKAWVDARGHETAVDVTEQIVRRIEEGRH